MATMAGALAGKALPHLTGLQDAAAGAAAACEETYGIFPCSSSVAGSLMLIAGYGFVLLKGANLISDGSELLLLVMDPGLIGGLVLPILGALPDAAMPLRTRLTCSSPTCPDAASLWPTLGL